MKEVKGIIKSTKHLSALSLLMEQNNIDEAKYSSAFFSYSLANFLIFIDNRHEQVYILFVEDVLSVYLAVSFVER